MSNGRSNTTESITMKLSLIVHPVSFSPGGKTALATAVALARFYQADLHLLELRGRRRSSPDLIVRSITDAGVEPHFAEFVQSVSYADVKVSAVELGGDVLGAVVDYARRTSADLVVVADRARSHGPYWRSGVYANDLTRHVTCPVLAVPDSHDAPTVPFTKILCPTDLSSSSMKAIDHALNLARQNEAKVTFLHVDEHYPSQAISSEGTKSRTEAIVRTIRQDILTNAVSDVESETLVRPGAIGFGIVATATEIGSDLIVIARPRRDVQVSMNSRLIQVLRQAPCPVLVVSATSSDHAPPLLEAVPVARRSMISR
jgi:nucleotide-binding universal stress UspA family protein